MRITCDINFWLDIAARPNEFPDSLEFFFLAQAKGIELCLPLSGYTTIYYVLSKLLSKKAAQEFLESLQTQNIVLLPFTLKEVSYANKLSFKDYEDACIVASAHNAGCKYLVTRNKKDFLGAPMKIISPHFAKSNF